MISVCMATYNGEKYIKEQIESILQNISNDDEIVISDDGSKDNTINIIKSFNDSRIKIFDGPKNGIKKNFENAIKKSNGDIIFLSDQDDIWMPDKVKKVYNVFKKNQGITLVMHDAKIVNEDLEDIKPYSTFSWRKSRPGIIKNIIYNSYIGCCIAFKKELKEKIIPIPNDIDMHDQWIGIISEKYGKSYFLNEQLIKYRRHNNNSSQMNHYPFKKMISNRMKFLKRLEER